jgi:pimeloyl-ACP methyl ester carboxylesterase
MEFRKYTSNLNQHQPHGMFRARKFFLKQPRALRCCSISVRSKFVLARTDCENGKDAIWNNGPLSRRSWWVKDDHHEVHLVQICATEVMDESDAPAILLLHGAIENHKIFISEKGKGLAPFLAKCGFNVFVMNLRGRGDSIPNLLDDPNHGQTDAIRKTIPSVARAVREISGRDKQTWLSHSWGGVLMTSAYTFDPLLLGMIDCCVHFGTKRDIKSHNFFSWLYFKDITFGWHFFFPLLAKLNGGGFPAKEYGVGGDGETSLSLKASKNWVMGNPWMDLEDGFNYRSAHDSLVTDGLTPPAMHIFSTNDLLLGNPIDVRRWAEQTHQTQNLLEIDTFDHVSMMTSKDADDAHFSQALKFIRKHIRTPHK